MIHGKDQIRQAYRDERVAVEYVKERFKEPLGALLHWHQSRILRRLIKQLQPRYVLEIAPGPGRLTADVARTFGGRGIVVDTSREMLGEARRRLQEDNVQEWRFLQGDAFNLPVKPEFDFVYSFRLIRHFDVLDRARLYAQAFAVLRPGGCLAFDVVNAAVAQPFRNRYGTQALHYYDAMLTSDDLRTELGESGFETVSLLGVQRRYLIQYWLQILVAPKSRFLARAAMELLEHTGGEPLEWVVWCRRR